MTPATEDMQAGAGGASSSSSSQVITGRCFRPDTINFYFYRVIK